MKTNYEKSDVFFGNRRTCKKCNHLMLQVYWDKQKEFYWCETCGTLLGIQVYEDEPNWLIIGESEIMKQFENEENIGNNCPVAPKINNEQVLRSKIPTNPNYGS